MIQYKDVEMWTTGRDGLPVMYLGVRPVNKLTVGEIKAQAISGVRDFVESEESKTLSIIMILASLGAFYMVAPRNNVPIEDDSLFFPKESKGDADQSRYKQENFAYFSLEERAKFALQQLEMRLSQQDLDAYCKTPYNQTMMETAEYFGLDYNLVKAQIWVESRNNRNAVNKTTGAKGPNQVMQSGFAQIYKICFDKDPHFRRIRKTETGQKIYSLLAGQLNGKETIQKEFEKAKSNPKLLGQIGIAYLAYVVDINNGNIPEALADFAGEKPIKGQKATEGQYYSKVNRQRDFNDDFDSVFDRLNLGDNYYENRDLAERVCRRYNRTR